ncbi:hypothetical protein [Bacillus badius]|uniref:hypothetical protein n=1 Tax=Bacillus badius TaxID=1455 RepID=UPI0005979B52|nr:hypothetical protein [Bacillus badius]KIL72532.1 hypothetical protein SD78_4117 [Bacillus badius]
MDSFLSLIIFTFPGITAYFWVQLFGFTPTVKYQGTEILAISAILWIPINFIVLIIYYLITVIYKFNTYYPIQMPAIYNFETLNELATNFLFVFYYVSMSVIVGYLLARLISGKFYDYMLDKVNAVRIKNNKAPLSKDASVWDTVFSKYVEQIVKVTKLGDQTEIIIGEIKHVSRTYELEKNVVLQHVSHWTEIMEHFHVDIDEVFFDIKSGMKIEVYNRDQCIEAQDLYLTPTEEETSPTS